jgi:hypothetical protein
MASTSRQWRTAELEALKDYDPAIIVALYARIPQKTDSDRPQRHVSFRCMIDAIVDAEESAADAEATSLVAT